MSSPTRHIAWTGEKQRGTCKLVIARYQIGGDCGAAGVADNNNSRWMKLVLELANRCIQLVQDFRRVVIAACFAHDAVGGVAVIVRIAWPDQRSGNHPVDFTCSVARQRGRAARIQITVQNDNQYPGVTGVSASE